MNKASISVVSTLLLAGAIPVWGQTNACDVNADGVVNVIDVQLVTDMYLGVLPCTAAIAGSGVCTPQVVQTVVNTALGGSCSMHYVTLNWTATTSSSISGYNVYRSGTTGGPYSKVNSSLVSTLTFTDTTVQPGQTYYYVCTAVNTSNVESSYSTQAAAAVPTP